MSASRWESPRPKWPRTSVEASCIAHRATGIVVAPTMAILWALPSMKPSRMACAAHADTRSRIVHTLVSGVKLLAPLPGKDGGALAARPLSGTHSPQFVMSQPISLGFHHVCFDGGKSFRGASTSLTEQLWPRST